MPGCQVFSIERAHQNWTYGLVLLVVKMPGLHKFMAAMNEFGRGDRVACLLFQWQLV
jgi:hypothetical protein